MSTSKLPVWLIAMMNSRPATNAALTAPLSALPTVAKCCEVGISHTKGGQHQGPLPTTSFRDTGNLTLDILANFFGTLAIRPHYVQRK